MGNQRLGWRDWKWGDPDLAKRAEDLGAEGAAEVLAAVRTRAEAWIKGTSAVLALVTASLVITDIRLTVRLYSSGGRWWLAILLVGSAGFGLLSLRFALRAANGPAWLDTLTGFHDDKSHARRDLARAHGAAKDLRAGQWSLTIAAALLILLIASTWVLPFD
jgi:hypothetical protein